MSCSATRAGRVALLALTLVVGSSGTAQSPSSWSYVALPTLAFNSDDGLAAGVLGQLFLSAPVPPYALTIQPKGSISTKGRQELQVFFDAPQLVGHGWRVDGLVSYVKEVQTPYFGVGNATVRDESLQQPPNLYYYQYGRTVTRLRVDAQRRLGTARLRALAGVGMFSGRTDSTPHGAGTTLLAAELAGSPPPAGTHGFVRAGLVYDTRDDETVPTKGTWADVLVQYAGVFTRATLTSREYVRLGTRLVFAGRVVLQQNWGDVPLYDLSTIGSSFKPAEGLGGMTSVRGLIKNRYLGDGLALSNFELRWRAADFTLLGKPSALMPSAFVDVGRAWTGVMTPRVFRDGHRTVGGGLRVRFGPTVVGGFDLGRSSEATQLYVSLSMPY